MKISNKHDFKFMLFVVSQWNYPSITYLVIILLLYTNIEQSIHHFSYIFVCM